MYKTTIHNGSHLADWYSPTEHKDREEIARLIGELVRKNKPWKRYEVIGADHLGEYAYFNAPTLVSAVMGMATFLLNYPFEFHSGCPKELTFEMVQTDAIDRPVWFCSYPQKQCGWMNIDRLQARNTK